MIKKMVGLTVGVSVGSVAVSEANKMNEPMGFVLGTTVGAGMVTQQLGNKKKGGMF